VLNLQVNLQPLNHGASSKERFDKVAVARDFQLARQYFLDRVQSIMLPDWSQRFKVVKDAPEYGIGAASQIDPQTSAARPIALFAKYLSSSQLVGLLTFVTATEIWTRINISYFRRHAIEHKGS
jgi:hypothetical protein